MEADEVKKESLSKDTAENKTVQLSGEGYRLTRMSIEELSNVPQNHPKLLKTIIENEEMYDVFRCLPFNKQVPLYKAVRDRMTLGERYEIENLIRSSRENDNPCTPICYNSNVWAEKKQQTKNVTVPDKIKVVKRNYSAETSNSCKECQKIISNEFNNYQRIR